MEKRYLQYHHMLCMSTQIDEATPDTLSRTHLSVSWPWSITHRTQHRDNDLFDGQGYSRAEMTPPVQFIPKKTTPLWWMTFNTTLVHENETINQCMIPDRYWWISFRIKFNTMLLRQSSPLLSEQCMCDVQHANTDVFWFLGTFRPHIVNWNQHPITPT